MPPNKRYTSPWRNAIQTGEKWTRAYIGCGGVGGRGALGSPRRHAASPRTPQTLAAGAGRSKAVDCGEKREGASSSRRVGLRRSGQGLGVLLLRPASCQAVESKHRIWEEDGGETVRGGGVAAGCVGKLAARRKRNRRSESRAGCAAPTRQLNKAANRTCGKLPTCNCNLVTLVTEKKKLFNILRHIKS